MQSVVVGEAKKEKHYVFFLKKKQQKITKRSMELHEGVWNSAVRELEAELARVQGSESSLNTAQLHRWFLLLSFVFV